MKLYFSGIFSLNERQGYPANINNLTDTQKLESSVQTYLEEFFSKIAPNANLNILGTHNTKWLENEGSINALDFAITLRKHNILNVKARPLLSKVVVGVGDAKSRGTSPEGEEPLGQIMKYMTNIMQAHQQKRTTLYGFLTNYDQVMFLKTTAEKGRVVEILRTRPMPFISDDSSNVSEGVKLLVGLLNMNVC